MFSYLLENESIAGTNGYLTLDHLTRTSRLYVARLRRLSTMPERMVTSFMNTERDLENLELFQADAIAYGQMLSLLNIKRIFLEHCATGLQEITSSILMQSNALQTDTTLPHNRNIVRRALRPLNGNELNLGYNSRGSTTEPVTDESDH